MDRILRALGPALLALAFAVAGGAQDDDVTFITDAMRGSLTQMKLGELAQERGGTEAVRAFGKTLVTDYCSRFKEASAVGKALDVTPATWPVAEAVEQYQAMALLAPEEFDRQFARHMATAHMKKITAYRRQAEHGGNRSVAEFARHSLPMLESHLHSADRLYNELQAD